MELRLHRGFPTPVGSFWHSYTDFPELYDRFALATLEAAKKVHELIDFRGARVLDIASGTGRNAFEHAKRARSVVGIEPFETMRDFATARAGARGVTNVEFRDGIAEDLSMFGDDSFDVAVSMYGAPFPWDTNDSFVRGCERVVRGGGHIIVVVTTPGWRAAYARSPAVPFGNPEAEQAVDHRLKELGFSIQDFAVDLDYGTEQEALETFGFIYGPAAIDHILDNKTSHQEWAVRAYIKRV
jgi:ubiquinone/menaquinone biosynthesis C-methylase UbiE